MLKKFIQDEEIQLDEQSDFLNSKVYVNSLRNMIEKAPLDKPFTIGLFGEWGSGKSSIIKTVREQLEGGVEIINRFAVFDAWKYSGDAFRRSFILSVQDQLEVNLDKTEHNLYENLTQRISELKWNLPKWIYYLFIGLIITFIVSYFYFPNFKSFIKELTIYSTLTGLATFIILLFKRLFKDEWVTKALEFLSFTTLTKYDVEKPLMFSPEQFSKAFEEILDKAKPINGRVIIVIDNIDRCEKDYACELLGTIKGFLEQKENVLFILPVDDRALRNHIKASFNNTNRDADEFLRKFFNVTLQIKPYSSVEIYEFASRLNSKNEFGFKDETIDLVSKEYATNPRRIIQMFNNLASELICFDEDFAEMYQIQIAKVLILREEFPDYFILLSKNPYILNEPTELISSFLEDEKNKEVKNFLNKTRVLTENLKLEILNKILSNSNVFNSIPSEIQSYIDSLDVDKVSQFIGEDLERKNVVVNYLIKNLEDYSNRNLFSMTFLNSLSLLISLNELQIFQESVHTRIEEIIKPKLTEIFKHKVGYEDLVTYSKSLQSISKNYLKNSLVPYISEQLSLEESDIVAHGNAFKKYLELFPTDESIKEFSESYKVVYEVGLEPISILELSSFQLKELITEELKDLIIEHLTELNNSSEEYKEIQFLLSNSQLSEAHEQAIINRFLEILQNLKDKSQKEISGYLEYINNLLQFFKYKHGENLSSLYNLVIGDREITSTAYPYTSKKNFVDEIIDLNESIALISSFCTNVYILESIDNLTVETYSKILLDDSSRDIVNADFAKLVDLNLDLGLLKSIILKDESYKPSHFKVLRYLVLFRDNEGKGTLEESELKRLFSTLILEYLATPTEALSLLLNEFTKEKKLRDIISSIVVTQSDEQILKLPDEVIKGSFDAFFESDDLTRLEDNMQILSSIGRLGNKGHIGKLVNIILRKLLVESSFYNGVELITQVEKFNNTDRGRLLRELENKTSLEHQFRVDNALLHLRNMAN